MNYEHDDSRNCTLVDANFHEPKPDTTILIELILALET